MEHPDYPVLKKITLNINSGDEFYRQTTNSEYFVNFFYE